MGGVTLRLRIVRLQKDDHEHSELAVSIYRVEITDLEKKGFFMIKRRKSQDLRLVEEQTYVVDKVKLCINKKGEVVITSTQKTTIQEEKDDTFTIHSLELSQHYDQDIEEY